MPTLLIREHVHAALVSAPVPEARLSPESLRWQRRQGSLRGFQNARTGQAGCTRFHRKAAELSHWTTLPAPRFAARRRQSVLGGPAGPAAFVTLTGSSKNLIRLL